MAESQRVRIRAKHALSVGGMRLVPGEEATIPKALAASFGPDYVEELGGAATATGAGEQKTKATEPPKDKQARAPKDKGAAAPKDG